MKARWPQAFATVFLLTGCGATQPLASTAATGGAISTPASPATSPAAAASGQAIVSGAAKSYTFGVMIPLTGPPANIGAEFKRSVDLGVEVINAAGGVDGWTLEPSYQDNKGTAQGGTESMNQLANITKVPFSITSFSGSTLAAQPMAAQDHVLLVNSGATDSNLLSKPWLYNDQAMAPQLMPPLAAYAYGEGKRKVAILVSNDPYGDGSQKAFAPEWQKLGGQIVDSETFPLNATDFSAQLTKIKNANADVVMQVAVGATQGQLLKQTRALGIQTEVIGPLGTSDTIKLGGDAANGFVDSSIAVDPSTTDAGAKAFFDAYRKKYSTEPEWNDGTPFEVVYLLRDLIDASTKAGTDPRSGDALLKALQAHPEFHNYLAGGTVKFNAQQSVDRALAIRKVVNGQFQTIKVVNPQS